MRCSIAVAKL
jgi:sulfate permease, SulP family